MPVAARKESAFLFDLDGTLIDSVYQHVIAWREALEQVGVSLAVWKIHRRIGMSGGLFVTALRRELEAQVHDDEDDAFYIVEGEMTFIFGEALAKASPGPFVLVPPGVEHGFRNEGAQPVRMLNIHAPAGFDRRIGLGDP